MCRQPTHQVFILPNVHPSRTYPTLNPQSLRPPHPSLIPIANLLLLARQNKTILPAREETYTLPKRRRHPSIAHQQQTEPDGKQGVARSPHAEQTGRE